MSQPTWVLQTNITSADSEDKLQRFLTAQGTPVVPFKIVFSDPAPALRYGTELLNHDSDVMFVSDFIKRDYPDDSSLFVRPTLDTKAVVGAVRSFGEWKERLTDFIGQQGGPAPDTLVQVAPPKKVINEWRVCILNGKPITLSTYRVNKRPNQGGPLPRRVLKYVWEITQTYSPLPVYMLDVCELDDGTLKVIEVNCANCSGFYWMDVYEIARQVTDFVAQTY